MLCFLSDLYQVASALYDFNLQQTARSGTDHLRVIRVDAAFGCDKSPKSGCRRRSDDRSQISRIPQILQKQNMILPHQNLMKVMLCNFTDRGDSLRRHGAGNFPKQRI